MQSPFPQRRTAAARWPAFGASLVLAAGALFAAPPAVPPGRSPLLAATVTDVDPASLRPPLRLTAKPSFDARTTDHVFIVAVYDRAALGPQPFDQRIRLLLPSGHLYQERVRPVDAGAGTTPTMVQRADLAVHPVRSAKLSGVRLAAGAAGRGARDAAITKEVLPVSGSWVTRHGLYGTWTAEVSLVRDGKVLATTTTTFELKGGGR